jgi:hypothetical protein
VALAVSQAAQRRLSQTDPSTLKVHGKVVEDSKRRRLPQQRMEENDSVGRDYA